jgi:tRNA(adenine34) deaminase
MAYPIVGARVDFMASKLHIGKKRKQRSEAKMQQNKKWVRDVKTVSTSPPEGIFTKDANTIARTMASKKVSPKGIGSGIRMVQFFINRAGKNLSAKQRRELEKAKVLLHERAEKKR